MAGSKYEINMTNGPLFGKILKMSLPLMFTGILQLLYNAADVVVVGQFAGSQALAAVGSTTSLINMLVNVFLGISLGAGVVSAQYIGAENKVMVQKAVHTGLTLSVILGFIVCLLGVFLGKNILELMQTPPDVLPLATLYVKIYFLGMPGFMIYNFSAAILRSAGDTKRPLIILASTGMVNVILNLILVIGFDMGVAGVAIATITSQYLSAISVVILLVKTKSDYKLDIKKLGVNGKIFISILKYGLPIGIQSSLFSISNVLIQSNINSFGSVVVAGNSAAANIEGFIFTAADAPAQAALTFTSQNVGAGKVERVKKVLINSAAICLMISVFFSSIIFFFSKQLLSVYSGDQAVILAGIARTSIIAPACIFCGQMGVIANVIRGMGYSVIPMLTTFFFVCVLRVVWIFTVFPIFGTVTSIYYSYPLTWALAIIFHFICYMCIRKKPKVRL